MPTRKTTTTSSAVKNRWNAAHYTRFTFVLEKKEAAEYKKECDKQGLNYSQIPKDAIQSFLRGS